MTGEIVEKKVPTWKIWGTHGAGLLGMILSIILIAFLLIFTFVESLRPDFLTEDWNRLGIYYSLIGASGSLVTGLIRFLLGSLQVVQAFEMMKDIVSALTSYLLYMLFPFDLNEDYEQIVRIVLIVAVVGSLISAINNLSKTVNWNPEDDVSLLKQN